MCGPYALWLQDGSAVAMTETVQGTYRFDLTSLQTMGRVRSGWRRVLAAAAAAGGRPADCILSGHSSLVTKSSWWPF